MTLSFQERSNYFRGLLVLMKMDRRIDDAEREILEKLGAKLGFESKFCHNAIDDLMENEYLSEDIPVFSKKEFAESFIIDGLLLSFSDNELNPEELNYLKKTLHLNDLSESWFKKQIKELLSSYDYKNFGNKLNIEKYLDDEEFINA